MARDKNLYRVLLAIEVLTREKGYPPTCREVGDYIGLAYTSVFRWMQIAEQQGKLKRDTKIARSARVIAG